MFITQLSTVRLELWIRTSVIPENISSLYGWVSSRFCESEERSKRIIRKGWGSFYCFKRTRSEGYYYRIAVPGRRRSRLNLYFKPFQFPSTIQ
ncbi:hypothetical protein TNIN_148271 [Trichonephila inaurata madagascariensis]|uniref:Uncharacterized protein n=1 Tax=Trichonephila inaurata madagascariensis TaxID=2747483 RepID=A0A8X7BP98_9ARAC|nr:hypothetical protein TNIN_148271 [Trichonephila inaurata madagascariensis]